MDHYLSPEKSQRLTVLIKAAASHHQSDDTYIVGVR
jgi:hypothetical protein